MNNEQIKSLSTSVAKTILGKFGWHNFLGSVQKNLQDILPIVINQLGSRHHIIVRDMTGIEMCIAIAPFNMKLNVAVEEIDKTWDEVFVNPEDDINFNRDFKKVVEKLSEKGFEMVPCHRWVEPD